MRVLASTFGGDDPDKVIHAMRALPYDRLVLIGASSISSSRGLKEIEELEELAGRRVDVEHVDEEKFLDQVDAVSEILARHVKEGARGPHNSVALNISGGPKILGDAAILAAFRLGIETYHCDERVTKLPILKGATAVDMLTPLQTEFMTCVCAGKLTLDDVSSRLENRSRQSAERGLRELRKLGLLRAEVRQGKIHLALTESGREMERMVRLTSGDRLAKRR